MATYCQIFEPVKPMTVSTPSLRAAMAVRFISSAARWRTPSASPSPQTFAPTIASWRKSIGSSQTAWPLRWFEIANSFRSYLSRMSSRDCT